MAFTEDIEDLKLKLADLDIEIQTKYPDETRYQRSARIMKQMQEIYRIEAKIKAMGVRE